MRGVLFSWAVIPILGYSLGVHLEPSALFRFSLSSPGAATAWEAGGAFGVRLDASALVEKTRLRLSGAVWAEDGVAQAAVLESYVEVPWDDFRFAMGKRTDLGGPWNDTLMGQDGEFGVFARYSPSALGWLGLEVAYLPNPAFFGGRGYVGLAAGPVRVGTLAEVVSEPDFSNPSSVVTRWLWNPRAGLDFGDYGLFWQLDRGFWLSVSQPVPLGEMAHAVLSQGGAGLDAELRGELDQVRLNALLWWNPDWGTLDFSDPFKEPSEVWQDFFYQPRKLLVGVSATWKDQVGFGFDASIAPVEAYKFWIGYRVGERP